MARRSSKTRRFQASISPSCIWERALFFKGPLCPSSPAFVEGPMFLSLCVNTHRVGVTEPRLFFIIYIACGGKVAWICHLCTSYLFTLSFCAYFRYIFLETRSLPGPSLQLVLCFLSHFSVLKSHFLKFLHRVGDAKLSTRRFACLLTTWNPAKRAVQISCFSPKYVTSCVFTLHLISQEERCHFFF